MPDQMPTVENTYLLRQFGLFEFIRKIREDQLSVLVPSTFDRRLIEFRMFRNQYFFVNWPDYIEQVLLNNHHKYVKGRFSDAMLGPIFGEGLLTSEGEVWRRRRRIEAPAFHHRSVAGFADTMVRSTNAMLDKWEKRGQPFDVAAEMTELTLDIITRTMFSTDIKDDVDRLKRLMQAILHVDRPSMVDLLGLPRWIPRAGAKSLRQTMAELDQIVLRILAGRRQGSTRHEDLLSLLLGARDPETGEGLTDKQLRDEIMTIFFAGHETTANALAFTWYMLATNPGVEARLQQELEQVLGGRAPTFADVPALRYTRMVLDETMRLYSPAYSLGRQAIEPDVIGGVPVPKGAIISIYPYVTHRNPVLWPDPDRFDPERFAPENAAGRHRFAYLPFGGGPRICIGQGFALTEAVIVIASVAQRFKLSMASGHTVQPIGLLTLRPKDGIWVTAASRQRDTARRMQAAI